MILAPCKGCPRREVGCHISCKAYQEYRKESQEEKKARADRKHFEKLLVNNRGKKRKR